MKGNKLPTALHHRHVARHRGPGAVFSSSFQPSIGPVVFLLFCDWNQHTTTYPDLLGFFRGGVCPFKATNPKRRVPLCAKKIRWRSGGVASHIMGLEPGDMPGIGLMGDFSRIPSGLGTKSWEGEGSSP